MTTLDSSRKDCNVKVDTGDPALPVAGTGRLSKVRKSRRARWRAAVLIGVHVIVAIHVAHFLMAGSTLSPVEPSESMYTLELGYVNAGFVFFLLALLSTLVLGRFFCGWGCHLVALQDLCGWMMKKLGVKPRPFRSRLLLWVPLLLALYMFVWPNFKRIVIDQAPRPYEFSNHLFTSGFWDTFPGPLIGALTFLSCGFVAVYLLGAKGFCTYACPYGGFFGVVDTFAPGRILVTDACDQCGHCTATCTSNVRVNEEVRAFGRVVDPGCMKCMDCVDVCPKNALYFGFGRPAVLKGGPVGAAPPKPVRYDFTWPEEIVMGLLCLAGLLAFRSLYDGPPLLMATCLGGVTAFIALKLWRLWRDPVVWVQNLRLKSGGKLGRSGVAFAACGALWLVFTAHSGFVQYHRWGGRVALERTEATRAEMLDGSYRGRQYSATHEQAVRSGLRHFSLADRWGLFDVIEVKLGLAWLHWLRDEPDMAEDSVRQALALAPRSPQQHQNLAEFLEAQGRFGEAVEAWRGKLALGPSAEEPTDRAALAVLLLKAERYDDAVAEYRRAIELDPGSPDLRYALGGLLRGLGRDAEASVELAAAVDAMQRSASGRSPTLAERIRLAALFVETGRYEEALEEYAAAIELAPDSAELRYNLGGLLRRLGRPADAVGQLEIARELAPADRDTHVELGLALLAAGRAEDGLAGLRRAVELDPDSPESRLYLGPLIERLESGEPPPGP